MKTIEKSKLPELMRAVIGSGKTLVAPVKDGKTSRFAEIKDPAQAALDLQVTKVSLKEFFLPATECILHYKRNEDGEVIVKDPAPMSAERVVFGSRPCDAAALDIMDKVFTWDYQDSIYLDRRAKTTIVSIACDKKAPTCRCTEVGLNPATELGSDIMLVPVDGGKFAVKVLTEKGEKLAAALGALLVESGDLKLPEVPPPAPPDPAVIENMKRNFDSPSWIDETMKCLGCGICAYICPTCHCFDIVDEDSDKENGTRRRNWDCCAFSTFTKHGSGHNPRSEQWHRYRQRLLHKFEYYPEKFGVTACVGCGRCLASCPVGMDIFKIFERLNTSE